MDILNSRVLPTLLFHLSIFSFFLFFLTSCQITYLSKNAIEQVRIFTSRVKIEKVLTETNLTEVEREKLLLVRKVKDFSENQLHLKKSDNYTTYVKLNRPYVSYVVSAAEPWELKSYLWDFPIVGKVPYKGHFSLEDAQDEEATLKKKQLDTYLRGVSAFSTLGWFNDPILSSMLRSSNENFVNTLIHESVHATIYIKNSADFNEQLATFIGNKGTELYYLKEEGVDSPTIRKIRNANEDDRIFSTFLKTELNDLSKWFDEQKQNQHFDEKKRAEKFAQLQKKFQIEVLPKMKTDNYIHFYRNPINNAHLLNYKTYYYDLTDFQNLFDKLNGDIKKFILLCRSLEDQSNPSEGLKKIIHSSN